MSGWTLSVVAVAVLGAAAPALAQEPPPRAPGCYDVRLWPWRPAPVPGQPRDATPPAADDSLFYAVPPRVELSARPVRWPEPAWEAAAPEGALPVGHPRQLWRIQDAGLFLLYGDGLTGVAGVLRREREGWRGFLRTYGDGSGDPRFERETALTRVDCASPPPVSDESVWRLPRTVRLEAGHQLTLGEAPPAGLPTVARPTGATAVAARTSGLFAGSDSVAFVAGPAGVGRVELTYLPPASMEDLVEQLSQVYGPPDGGREPAWNGRITRIRVGALSGGGFRVVLRDPRIG